MKKIYKIGLIAAGSLIAVSVVTLSICAIVSGSSVAHNIKQSLIIPETKQILEHVTDEQISSHHTSFDDDANIYTDNGHVHCDFDDEYPIYSGDHTDMQAASASQIHNLYISIGGGKFIVSESTDDNYYQISAKSDNRFQYYTKGDTFYIIGFDDASTHLRTSYNDMITFQIPSDASFDHVTMELGAGTTTWDFLTTDSLSVEAGAGTVVMKNINANNLDAEIGAGTMEMYSSTLEDADLEVGLGSLTYSGVIRGDMTTECGMGSADLSLSDSEKKHNYSLEGGMGHIAIGTHQYNGIGYEQSIDNEASSNYTLSCAMGSITITFED